jgi:hypothetical protein
VRNLISLTKKKNLNWMCLRKGYCEDYLDLQRKNWQAVGFEVFRAVVMKSIIIWDMTPCSPSSFNRRFGGTYHLHHQGRKNRFSKPASKLHSGGYEEYHLLGSSCLLVCWTYFFDPENGGDMFLRNVGWNSTDYTASYPRRWYSSYFICFCWLHWLLEEI